jgi:hypothetical protein
LAVDERGAYPLDDPHRHHGRREAILNLIDLRPVIGVSNLRQPLAGFHVNRYFLPSPLHGL